MLPGELTHDIKSRLKTIRGQTDGLIKMLDKEADPGKIIDQFKAVRLGLQTAEAILLDEVYRKALAIKIVEVSEACPGNCGNEKKIEFIRKQFPKLTLDEIVDKFREIQQIGEKVEVHRKKS